MRYGKLLFGAAAAMVLATPAFAQSGMQPTDPNQQPQSQMPNSSGNPSGQPAQGMNEPGATTNNMAPTPDMSQPQATQPGATGQPATSSGTRLYSSTTTNEQGVAVTVISNGPVADTPANRAKFRPLSNAGRRTAPRGN